MPSPVAGQNIVALWKRLESVKQTLWRGGILNEGECENEREHRKEGREIKYQEVQRDRGLEGCHAGFVLHSNQRCHPL